MSRRMTADEQAAFAGLVNGDLEPFAALLSQEKDALHPILQRRLLSMIEQWEGQEHVLMTKLRRGLNPTTAQSFKRKKGGRDRRIAKRIMDARKANMSRVDAIHAAAVSEGVTDSVASAAYYEHRAEIEAIDRAMKARLSKNGASLSE